MSQAGKPGRDSTERTTLRHRRVPMRALGEALIVARPRDGAPVVLAPTAAFVWHQLDGWITPGEIDRRTADAFPEVAEKDRVKARTEILGMLTDDDLIEQG